MRTLRYVFGALVVAAAIVLPQAAQATPEWTPVTTIDSHTGAQSVRVTALGAGHFLSTWQNVAWQLVASVSSDAGATWSTPVPISAPENGGAPYRVATDGHQGVGVVWDAFDARGVTRANFSRDGGRTWLRTPQTFSDTSETAMNSDIVSGRPGEFTVTFTEHSTLDSRFHVFSRTTEGYGAQWTALHRVSGASIHGSWATVIRGPGNSLYATWMADFGSSSTVQFAVSRDEGTSWSTGVDVSTSNANASWYPAIAVTSSGRVAISWYRHVGDDWPIFASTSTDDGVSWSSEVQLSTTAGFSDSQNLSVDGSGRFVLVWHAIAGGSQIFAATSDGGVSWSSPVQVSQNGGATGPLVVRGAGGVFRCVWDEGDKIVTTTSSDGISWTPAVVISGDTRGKMGNSVATDGAYTVVAWSQDSAAAGGWVPVATGTPAFVAEPRALASTGTSVSSMLLCSLALVLVTCGGLLASLSHRRTRAPGKTLGR